MSELRRAGNLESSKCILGEQLHVTHTYICTHTYVNIYLSDLFKYVSGASFVTFSGTWWQTSTPSYVAVMLLREAY